ncbi:hypothetical protein PM082_003701 [Marasmius tenuissimus]|nr:hypothetical protein PM082_003701 [Marasmius tenuissimus]
MESGAPVEPDGPEVEVVPIGNRQGICTWSSTSTPVSLEGSKYANSFSIAATARFFGYADDTTIGVMVLLWSHYVVATRDLVHIPEPKQPEEIFQTLLRYQDLVATIQQTRHQAPPNHPDHHLPTSRPSRPSRQKTDILAGCLALKDTACNLTLTEMLQ